MSVIQEYLKSIQSPKLNKLSLKQKFALIKKHHKKNWKSAIFDNEKYYLPKTKQMYIKLSDEYSEEKVVAVMKDNANKDYNRLGLMNSVVFMNEFLINETNINEHITNFKMI